MNKRADIFTECNGVRVRIGDNNHLIVEERFFFWWFFKTSLYVPASLACEKI